MEFMIASALGIIVLLAVASSYLAARNLSQSASARLTVQQDLRHTANLIAHDARMAGSFGCFNMAGAPSSAVKADVAVQQGNGLNLAEADKEHLNPVKSLAARDFAPGNGFRTGSTALVFQYGQAISSSPQPKSSKPLIYSSCSALARTGSTTKPSEIAPLLGVTDSTGTNEISELHYIAHAYAVGKSGTQQGLFRFEADASGNWSKPQLLAANIHSWQIRYLALTPESCRTENGKRTTEAFDFSDTMPSETPVMVLIRLNGGQNVQLQSGHAVHVYDIAANIRKGNLCANRSI